MESYVKQWDDYSIEFNKKLVFQCRGDWRQLDRDEQEIAALWKLVVDMYNGGFEQFFCNWGYDCYWCAMRGIQRMGINELLELLHGTYTDVFDKFREDKRLKAYWDIPQYFTDEDIKTLEETDNAFYDGLGESLCKMACEFYRDDMKKTVEFDYVKMWDGLAGGYYFELERKYNGDWSALSEQGQEIAALWKLFDDMGNGGIERFFGSGEVCCENALRALEKVGCKRADELFRRAYDGLFTKINSHQALDGEDGELMMETDTTFWEGLDAELAKAAFVFYY